MTYAAGVAVPAGLFKIVVVPETGRRFGFVLSNEDHRPFRTAHESAEDYLENWRASLDVIEELTSLEFFPDASPRERRVMRLGCTETRWR